MKNSKSLITKTKEKLCKEKIDADDILQNFVCMICYGVVIDPVKCQGCETLYCRSCLPADALDGS